MLKLYVLREKNIFFYLINPIHRGGKIFHDKSNSCSFLVTLDILCNMCAILDARTQSSLPRIFFCPTDSIISNETIHYILYIYYMKKLTSACKSDDAKQQIQIYIYNSCARQRNLGRNVVTSSMMCDKCDSFKKISSSGFRARASRFGGNLRNDIAPFFFSACYIPQNALMVPDVSIMLLYINSPGAYISVLLCYHIYSTKSEQLIISFNKMLQ